MIQTRPAERGFPPFAKIPATVTAAVVLIVAILGFVALDPFDLQRPVIEPPSINLLQAEGRWELQRDLQSGTVDPLTAAGREWERQHRQQSNAY